jgi:N-ethylmaleimide reductase
MVDSQPEALVTYVAQELSRRAIAFLEIRHENHALPAEQTILQIARRQFRGVLMSNGSYTRESGESTVAGEAADGIVYGRPYIANPDLVERFAKRTPLNEVNFARLYGGGPDGYSDYPALAP